MLLNKGEISLALLLLALCIAANAKDYCNMPGCGKNHIACNNTGKFSVDCPPDVRIVDMNIHKEGILKFYNEMRSKVAAGEFKSLPTAKRSAEMEWDPELAYLAELKAKTCNHKTDKCPSTEKFVNAGQNTAIFSYSGDVTEYTDAQIIKKRLIQWFAEIDHVDRHIIASYPSERPEHSIGHATVIINEKNTNTGCAATRFTDGEYNRFLFICYYAITNIADEPVYNSGKTASGCEKTSKRYPNLCFNSEKYNLDIY